RLDVEGRVERREHVVRNRPTVAAFGPPYADPESQEVVRPEVLRDRAQAVVAGEPAAEPRLQPTLLEVGVVVDDERALGRDLVEAHRGADRAAGRSEEHTSELQSRGQL